MTSGSEDCSLSAKVNSKAREDGSSNPQERCKQRDLTVCPPTPVGLNCQLQGLLAQQEHCDLE